MCCNNTFKFLTNPVKLRPCECFVCINISLEYQRTDLPLSYKKFIHFTPRLGVYVSLRLTSRYSCLIDRSRYFICIILRSLKLSRRISETRVIRNQLKIKGTLMYIRLLSKLGYWWNVYYLSVYFNVELLKALEPSKSRAYTACHSTPGACTDRRDFDAILRRWCILNKNPAFFYSFEEHDSSEIYDIRLINFVNICKECRHITGHIDTR